MPTILSLPDRPSRRGEPVWELLELFPTQGRWTEEEYLAIDTNRIIEFVDGCLEVPPVPDSVHQMLVFLFCSILNQLAVDGRKGKALPSAFKLKIPNGNWREPDVVYLLPANLHRQSRKSWDYADLAIEIVSADNPSRDYEEKRRDYALAGVPEYWIVDPLQSCITVLQLESGAYREVQLAREGDVARSVVVQGLEADVTALFAQARE